MPNVLLVNVDHWPASLLGSAGHPAIKTPTLDMFARGGVRFENCYSDCPVCIPARRSLMTGMTPRTHGDRVYKDHLPMPKAQTLAGAFHDAGYQCIAVGKLHVYPQRDRIGFDEVILSEEGRYQMGVMDDYQIWLGENGYLGEEFAHAMGNNRYFTRPWHLPERAHNTSWAAHEMVRQIKRRDPTRPSFFYLSFIHPHPPLVPPQTYFDMYRDVDVPAPAMGQWEEKDTCFALSSLRADTAGDQALYDQDDIRAALRAFYAQCTYIDHQLRLVIGALREEGILNDTILVFASDHGDALFDHGVTAKRNFYENATNIPLILSGKPLAKYAGTVEKKLACLEDVMPTLLNLCGIDVPETVEGMDLFGEEKREMLFGEISDGPMATRMAVDGRYKLIYYPTGNLCQLFDLENDPKETKNLAKDESYRGVLEKLTAFMIDHFHDGDEAFAKDGMLVGVSDKPAKAGVDYGMHGQRGTHWPPPMIRN